MRKKSYCYDKKRNSLREQIEFTIELSIYKYTRIDIKKSRVESINVSVFYTNVNKETLVDSSGLKIFLFLPHSRHCQKEN